MTENSQPLKVMLDEGAPHSSAEPFLRNGYQAIYHGDVLGGGASDEMVAVTAMLNKAILIAVDRDMRRIVRRFGAGRDGDKFKDLNLIWVACDPVMATKRLAHAMSFIELEWDFRCRRSARRMWLSIENHKLTTHR